MPSTAGEPPSKDHVREAVWSRLDAAGEGAFPFPITGRIPNFRGSADAARRLAETREWERADVVKANPDAPQRHVRKRALEAGKVVYMAVPRLTDAACFVELDPRRVDAGEASSIRGAFRVGRQVAPGEMRPVDLVVSGSVAVNRAGARVGKGGGYADLEFGIARAHDLLHGETPVATTVHPLQVWEGALPREAHDVGVTVVCTPADVWRAAPAGGQPRGVVWEALSEEKRRSIPALDALRPG